MNEEKIVKINGIKISKTGFKNLQFETSRYSDGLNTIRGFGDMLNEQNLNNIDTVSIDFVLNDYELKDLAYIYCLFKANGILPIENEYLLKKIKSTYEEGKTSEEIKKDVFIKENISHLICFLQRMSITSLEKTNNAYQINMVLTLYNNVLTKNEFDEYMKCYDEWIKDTKFKDTCYEEIEKIISELAQDGVSSIDIDVYNIEELNSVYKEYIINNATVNSKLNLDTEIQNEQKANKRLENLKSKLDIVDISKAEPTRISIPNHSILQIEMITNNNISNVPIIGSPIGHKSYLGIGATHFTAKLIFNEWENDIVEELKKISDKNIVNHKIELNHPLVQLFDFHTSNILNIVFNNLEEANGIMVNIVFALNGFRFSEETTINTDELLHTIEYENDIDFKQEIIGGLYLEYLSDYLYRNRKSIDVSSSKELMLTPLESFIRNSGGSFDTYDADTSTKMFKSSYYFLDALSSYSSFPTCYSLYDITKTVNSTKSLNKPNYNKAIKFDSLFNHRPTSYTEWLNELYNKNLKTVVLSFKDIFLFNYEVPSRIKGTGFKDSSIKNNRSLFYCDKYYTFVDSISAISILGNNNYKNSISKSLYSEEFANKEQLYDYIINDVIKKLSTELFNTIQNGDSDIYKNEIYKKVYEEFFYRLFYNLNVNNIEIIEEIKNTSFVSANNSFIIFDKIYNYISKLSDIFYESFISTFYDGTFIERITLETIDDHLNNVQKLNIKNSVDLKVAEAKKNMNLFALEFENKYSKEKEKIKQRSYNIFLTKLNYFLLTSTLVQKKFNEYENIYGFVIDDPIKIYLLSSAIHGILLIKTSTRTDHFEKQIILNCKNIGYKISTYNSKLEKNNILNSSGDVVEYKNVMFYELFNNSSFNKNPFYYYKDKIKYEDFFYKNHSIFDNNPNKDINFFYGHKLTQSMLHKDLFDISTPYEYKENLDDVRVLINENRAYFNNSEIKDFYDFNKNELCINGIKFPMMNFGRIPSYYTELFYDDYKENKSYFLKNIMKQRIIGNIDPFRNLETLSDLVFENENYIIPDYDICIYKKESNSDYSGEIYKTINSRYYMFLKNASSISIVKNPKTKINTMTIVLNNTSKSIFNFDVSNGSFDMQSLKDGKIDIVHVEPGDEIRVRIGFDTKIQMFNGFINMIQNTGNQLILNCSSFASLLYNEKMVDLNMHAGSEPFCKSIFKSITSLCGSLTLTLDSLSTKQVDLIRSMHNVTNPLNDHLFISFDRNKYYNKVFAKREKATMYTAFNLAIARLNSFVSEKFIKSKLSDITKSNLVYEKAIKESLDDKFGIFKLDYQSDNKTYDIYTNINNVDVDYENYGICIEYGDEDSPEGLIMSNNSLSINNYAYTKKDDEEDVKVIQEYGSSNVDNINNKIDSANSEKKSYSIPSIVDTEGYGKLCLPVEKETNVITSLFKERRKRKNNTYREHSGIDICRNGNSSRNIYSVYDGYVIEVSETDSSAAGKYIKIRHRVPNKTDKYFVSSYMHLDSVNVKLNDYVVGGRLIGIMGDTGSSSGEHLHFELYIPNNRGEKHLLINPFDKNMLPRHTWNVRWDLVNIMADNGQYTSEWQKDYSKATKVIQYEKMKNGGR